MKFTLNWRSNSKSNLILEGMKLKTMSDQVKTISRKGKKTKKKLINNDMVADV